MNEVALDRFAKELENRVVLLQECQNGKQVQSCSQCEQFLDCEVRDGYVKAVYENMTKGQQGGFDFN